MCFWPESVFKLLKKEVKEKNKELRKIVGAVLGPEANSSLKCPKTYAASHEITAFRTLLWPSDDTDFFNTELPGRCVNL